MGQIRPRCNINIIIKNCQGIDSLGSTHRQLFPNIWIETVEASVRANKHYFSNSRYGRNPFVSQSVSEGIPFYATICRTENPFMLKRKIYCHRCLWHIQDDEPNSISLGSRAYRIPRLSLIPWSKYCISRDNIQGFFICCHRHERFINRDICVWGVSMRPHLPQTCTALLVKQHTGCPAGSAKILRTCPPGGAFPCIHCALESLAELSCALEVAAFSKVCKLAPCIFVWGHSASDLISYIGFRVNIKNNRCLNDFNRRFRLRLKVIGSLKTV